MRVAFVSPEFFRLLAVRPALGRTFTTAEDQRNAAPAVVLATDYWTERFGRTGACSADRW